MLGKMNKQEIINNISVALFNREYNDLKETERKFIDYFVYRKKIPAGLKMVLQTKAAEYISEEMEDEKETT
tara:strand:- start:60 stop:272 length:213 start_codon:yes stop_codon:yes gene_type:complete